MSEQPGDKQSSDNRESETESGEDLRSDEQAPEGLTDLGEVDDIDEDFIVESMQDTRSFEADTLNEEFADEEPSIQTLSQSAEALSGVLASDVEGDIVTLDEEFSDDEDVEGPAFAASVADDPPFAPPPLVEEYPASIDLDDALSDTDEPIETDYEIAPELDQALNDSNVDESAHDGDDASKEVPEKNQSVPVPQAGSAPTLEVADDQALEAFTDAANVIAPDMDEEGTPEPLILPFAFASSHNVMLDNNNKVIHVEPLSLNILTELRRCIGGPFEAERIGEEEFKIRLAKQYQAADGEAQLAAEEMGADFDLSALAEDIAEDGELLSGEGDAPVIRLINAILSQAVQEKASDIHVEQFEEKVSIRFRIDGVMKEILAPKPELGPVLVSRLKVMARLDIAEKRIPQDGRITVKLAGHAVDIRVSTMPAAHGERTVMRILDQAAGALGLEQLNMPSQVVEHFKAALHKPHGIILVTGPTGSGKTTSLYSALSYLNEPSRNILTVEDPVEYLLPGIGQTQVNTKVDMTFVRGLRAILRQDPDVVMIGEIRDKETAAIAVQASLTGHLLLSTLHTNTAIGAVTRLGDLGIEPFLLSSSLEALMAQRLVRVLCEDCKEPHEITEYESKRVGIPAGSQIYRPVGCVKCHHGGYKGRTGIYELIPVDDGLRQLIHEGVGEAKMLAHARERAESIEHDGRAKVLAGITSIEELLRVTATAS